MRHLCLLFCIFWLSSLSGKAQQTAPASGAQTNTQKTTAASSSVEQKAIDPQQEKDIRKLLDLMGTKKLMAQAITEMERTTRPTLEHALPSGEYRDKLIAAFFVKFRQKLDLQEVINQAVPIYDKYFSPEEIKGLIRFYETPLGQKSVSVLPQLTAELMDQGRKLGEAAGRQSMLEVLAENPDLEKQMEEAQKASQGTQP